MFIDTIVIGTGCAGYNAADWLYDLGHRDIAIVTEGIGMGTSRNTGSDKQTYYKLSLCGDGSDSVREMADTLFAGGSVHGDTAVIEAACSVKSFIKLANLGVPFPTNKYGEYVGYKTDHDPRTRATSAGPLTSKYMTEALERSVLSKGIRVIDKVQVIEILCSNNHVRGIAAIHKGTGKYLTYSCSNVILATGGSAGVYYRTVYPESQTGATGLALKAGAKAVNLQEWQYGLASTKFRWNVSGTYQQVLPRYVSVDSNGEEREFLPENISDPQRALDMVFLKGYQWPFDSRKIDCSSQIDLLVHNETVEKGNRVYLDFRSNPQGLENGFDGLSEETRSYLAKSEALFGTPIERLAKMNPKAIELYREHGIDLAQEMLEIAVCAQHQNGGIAVDLNWESSVNGLYAVGEAAGTFGVYRPGGSALNSTQVGSMRAAEHIAYKTGKMNNHDEVPPFIARKISYGCSNLATLRELSQKRMSECAAYLRDLPKMKELIVELTQIREHFSEVVILNDESELSDYYKFSDILETQISVLSATIFSAENIGTRGAALVTGNAKVSDKHLAEVVMTKGASYFEPIREIPNSDNWFETVWKEYNERINPEKE